MTHDTTLDLVLERIIDVPPNLVWEAWTTPEHLKKWFVPAPWSLADCELDLRPGGIFRSVMRSPEGQEFTETGCYLEIVPGRKIAWTNALLPGFRPIAKLEAACGGAHPDMQEGFLFTAIVAIEPHGSGTRYVATALHSTESGKKQHEQMGFHEGWGAALDQLVALLKKS